MEHKKTLFIILLTVVSAHIYLFAQLTTNENIIAQKPKNKNTQINVRNVVLKKKEVEKSKKNLGKVEKKKIVKKLPKTQSKNIVKTEKKQKKKRKEKPVKKIVETKPTKEYSKKKL